MHLCGMDYKYFSPHCCKCNSFGCMTAIKCGNACLGPHSYSLSSGSEHSQFNSPKLVKREEGFPNPGRALIGSNQLWRVNDSPYNREYLHVIRVIIVCNLSNLRGGPVGLQYIGLRLSHITFLNHEFGILKTEISDWSFTMAVVRECNNLNKSGPGSRFNTGIKIVFHVHYCYKDTWR